MFSTARTRPPAHLLLLIAAVTIVPLTILLWLGWRVVKQGRLLERQQTQQRLERGADLLVASLQRAVEVGEHQFSASAEEWPAGLVSVTFGREAVAVLPRDRIAYLPNVARGREAPASPFTRGDELELRHHDLDAAMAIYHRLAAAPDLPTRAGALVRLARSLQKAGRLEQALDAYRLLGEIDDVAIDGVPAALIGRYSRCSLLATLKRADALRAEAIDLEAAIHSARWDLAAGVYWLYSEDTAKWTGSDPDRFRESELFADAVAALSARRKVDGSAPVLASGRELLEVDGQPFTVLWTPFNEMSRALLVAPAFVESQWLQPLATILADTESVFALLDRNGTPVFGTKELNGGPTASRAMDDTSLPWTLVTASLDPPREARDFAIGRRLLMAGFIVLAFMASTASYLIIRAVSHEVAVARLQSDFVAAVSHEFRTPLTSLRQFTEMLREHSSLDDERRRVAYDAQSRATDRLTRLVESLLDFGRVQAGAHRYQFGPCDATVLVGGVVEEFRAAASATGHDVRFLGNGSTPMTLDEEAVSRAVRNLLENAVKYSPVPNAIDVSVTQREADVVIAVRDRGIGIPPGEQRSIFGRFHRGEQARIRGINGTGIGLAMVDEIVRAHRGRIEVESTPDHGSTFTIVLPGLTRPQEADVEA